MTRRIVNITAIGLAALAAPVIAGVVVLLAFAGVSLF